MAGRVYEIMGAPPLEEESDYASQVEMRRERARRAIERGRNWARYTWHEVKKFGRDTGERCLLLPVAVILAMLGPCCCCFRAR